MNPGETHAESVRGEWAPGSAFPEPPKGWVCFRGDGTETKVRGGTRDDNAMASSVAADPFNRYTVTAQTLNSGTSNNQLRLVAIPSEETAGGIR